MWVLGPTGLNRTSVLMKQDFYIRYSGHHVERHICRKYQDSVNITFSQLNLSTKQWAWNRWSVKSFWLTMASFDYILPGMSGKKLNGQFRYFPNSNIHDIALVWRQNVANGHRTLFKAITVGRAQGNMYSYKDDQKAKGSRFKVRARALLILNNCSVRVRLKSCSVRKA